jgi:ABC-2 type transport system ATP-binding protein
MKLIIKDLTKTYPNGIKALNNVNLIIEQGVFGLLGPNGAGKSTLIKTIATLQDPDSGSIQFNGMEVSKNKDEIRKCLGYLPQEFGLYPNVSAEDLLNHLAYLKGISKNSERREVVQELLNRVNLFEVRKQMLGGFSGGMKQRFGIAQALLSNPKLIVVDEPTSGLDPYERNRFLNLLSELGEQVVVILSTHIVEDVRALCNDMAILYKGQVLFEGSPLEAIDEIKGMVWRKRIKKEELREYHEDYNIISERMLAGSPVIKVLNENCPEGFEAVEADLEDVYFHHITFADIKYQMMLEG